MIIGKSKVIVPRKELLTMMQSYSDKRAIYIYAPAGYGKTVAANLWLAGLGVPHASIALDEYSNAMEDFCRMFCVAMASLQKENTKLQELVNHDAFSSAPEEFALRAAQALPATLRAAFVLDDLHEVHAQPVHKMMGTLFKRLPPGVKVCIVSRNAPPKGFATFVLKDEMGIVPAEQLRFSADEIYQFFLKNGCKVTRESAAQAQEYTDGWAIGLNAILLAGEGLPKRRIVQSHLGNYVQEQLWSKWGEKTRAFMLHTAVEEELNPSLCTALTGEQDAGGMLQLLVDQNAFLIETGEGVYRFHRLFREFLLQQLDEEPGLREVQLKKAAAWYLQEKNFYKAVERFAACQDHAGIASCFGFLEDMEHEGFAFEAMLAALPLLNEALLAEYPFLLYMHAYGAFVEGRYADMIGYLDRYYASYPAILAQTPQYAHNVLYLRAIDVRVSMRALVDELRTMPERPEIRGIRGSTSQKLPLLHRSVRDFSEFALGDTDVLLAQAKEVIGGFLGGEQDVLVNCLRAGLRYEQGNLREAHSITLQLNADVQPHFSSEAKFCAMMLLAHILRALWQYDSAEVVIKEVRDMIEREGAYYLSNNLAAYALKSSLERENRQEAAQRWVDENEDPAYTGLTLYGLCRHFTTARAYIAMERYDRAIIQLQRLLELCEAYRRPLDGIEVRVLLSIALWKKAKNSQKEALAHLEEALRQAHPYGFTQVFVNEGPALVNMLYRIQSYMVRQAACDDALSSFTKKIYAIVLLQARNDTGSTPGKAAKTFTAKQKQVMRLLCEGQSYRQIAEAMGVKFSTVRSHLDLIYHKLDVPNAMEAILKIQELGLLDE